MPTYHMTLYHLYDNMSHDNFPVISVDKKERKAGHDPEQELKDSGFHDVGRV